MYNMTNTTADVLLNVFKEDFNVNKIGRFFLSFLLSSLVKHTKTENYIRITDVFCVRNV